MQDPLTTLPPVPPMLPPCKPTRWRTLRMPSGIRTLPPTPAELARNYAERWYQALKAWRVEVAIPEIPRNNYAAFRPDFDPISTLGECGPDLPSILITPAGEVREGEVALIISRMTASQVAEQRATGLLLERVRGGGRVPGSLLRENGGWQPNAPRHAAFAVAALTLAVQLNDREAERHLPYCRAVMTGTCKQSGENVQL